MTHWVCRTIVGDLSNPKQPPPGTTDILVYPPKDTLAEFYRSELIAGRVRQGWGLPGLDLRQPPGDWARAARLAAKAFWGEDFTETETAGVLRGFRRMTEPLPGDWVWIPNWPDYDHCTVIIVVAPYWFEDRSGLPGWQKDFGHVIGVGKPAHFVYGPPDLVKRSTLGPYRKPVNRVEKAEVVALLDAQLKRLGLA